MTEKKIYWPVVVAVVSVITMMFLIILLGYFTSSERSLSVLRTIMDLQVRFRALMTQFLGTLLVETLSTGASMGILTNVTGGI